MRGLRGERAVASRFFFHLIKGQQRIPDRVGAVVAPDIVMSASVLNVAQDVWPGLGNPAAWAGWSIEICDANGNVVRVISVV
jgi:hypothetical protein